MMPLESTAMGAISNPNNQGRSSSALGRAAAGPFRFFVAMAKEGYHGTAGDSGCGELIPTSRVSNDAVGCGARIRRVRLRAYFTGPRQIIVATYAAPKPLSILTTVTLGEQEFNIPSSAAKP